MIRTRLAIPFGRDGSGRFLPWLVALMVFLAALALAAVMGLERDLARWNAGLAGTLTVELPARPAHAGKDREPAHAGKDREPAKAGQIRNDDELAAVLAALRAAPGVKSATPLSRDEVARLVEPYLGQALSPDDLALPRLIDLRLDPARPADPADLKARLRQAAPAASLDDHRLWLDNLARFARSVELTAFLILGLIAASAALCVMFVTRTGLSVHRDVIELLHLMGAHDFYVARLFEREALRLGLIGGLGGLALAAATLLALGHAAGALAAFGEGVTLLPALHLKGWDYAALAALPPIAGIVAMATARITVLAALLRLP